MKELEVGNVLEKRKELENVIMWKSSPDSGYLQLFSPVTEHSQARYSALVVMSARCGPL